MLKRFTLRRIAIATLLLLLAFLLYNYPEEINNTNIESKNDKINIFLIDENNFVGMTEIENNNSSDKIEYIINSLIVGNNPKLPKGFEAIIAKNTRLLDYSLDNGLLKINFSKEFLDIDIDLEDKMIQTIIYSLTAINDVKKIMIFVEGNHLNELPKSHKRLDLYLDRNYGINRIIDITDVKNSSMVTIYYLSKNDYYYFVPVSYISNNDNKIEVLINSLKSNRLNNSNLLSHLNYQVELMNYETTEEEITLNFNNVLLNSVYDGKLKEEIKYAVAYSIYDTLGIENVVFMVDSVKIDEFRLAN